MDEQLKKYRWRDSTPLFPETRPGEIGLYRSDDVDRVVEKLKARIAQLEKEEETMK
mgnify:CR=1 FL=1